jgi:hypothetical protein
MVTSTAVITHPIALCAYVISAVFVLLTKKWNPKSDKPRDRQLFYLAATVAIVALVGGLSLAWQQIQRKSRLAVPIPVNQTSFGDQSPNVNSSGSGSVTVQTGNTSPPSSAKPEEKKK